MLGLASSPEVPRYARSSMPGARLYASAVVLAVLSVPFLHLYLRVDLTAGALVLHSLDIGLGVALVCIGHRVAAALVGRTGWSALVQRTVLGALILLLVYLACPPALLPGTAAILAQHRLAGHPELDLRMLPMTALIAYLAWCVVRRRDLLRELVAVRGILRERERVAFTREQRPSPAPPRPAAEAPTSASPRTPEPKPLVLHHDRGVWIVPAEEIIRVEAMENYCELWLDPKDGDPKPRRVLVRKTLAEIRDSLPERLFAQAHRSHLVRIDRVRALVRDGRSAWLEVEAAGRVPVARSRVADLAVRVERAAH